LPGFFILTVCGVFCRLRCPVCKTDVRWENNPFRPFCSERCKLVDLGAWAEGRYVIAGEEHDDDKQSEVMSDDDEED
jgi:uncharacterized protein